MASNFNLSSSSTPRQHGQLLSNDDGIRPTTSNGTVSSGFNDSFGWQGFQLAPSNTAPAATSVSPGSAASPCTVPVLQGAGAGAAAQGTPASSSTRLPNGQAPTATHHERRESTMSRSATPRAEQMFASRRPSLADLHQSEAPFAAAMPAATAPQTTLAARSDLEARTQPPPNFVSRRPSLVSVHAAAVTYGSLQPPSRSQPTFVPVSRRPSFANAHAAAAYGDLDLDAPTRSGLGMGIGMGSVFRSPGGVTSAAPRSEAIAASEQRQADLREKIGKETKIRRGTENMLEALLAKNPKHTKEQRLRVESELNASQQKINDLQRQLDEEVQRGGNGGCSPTGSTGHLPVVFHGTGPHPDLQGLPGFGQLGADAEEEQQEEESPSFVLSETLQALEEVGMPPDFYIERANSLVEQLRRTPTLKYDLVWSIFGLRIQSLLLSDSREVVAAGYRLARYAITDRQSLKIIRGLHTDELVSMSLAAETKASLEREQALKFVRAFLDVHDGVHEVSVLVARTLVSIAEMPEDRLRSICIVTLAEMLVKNPELVYAAGGIGLLSDILAEGSFGAAESLVSSFLYILDTPRRRRFSRKGSELEGVFASFTASVTDADAITKMRTSARVISAMLKSWQGLTILSQRNARPLRSLLDSLQFPDSQTRDLILELISDALRIKAPSWSSSYFAGRRLTTYGRLTNLKATRGDSSSSRAVYADAQYSDSSAFDLTTHFSSLVLATLVQAGLIESLSVLVEVESDISVKRKATLLLTEVLNLCHYCLPRSMSDNLQPLPDLVALSSIYYTLNPQNSKPSSTSTIYQIDSISRTLMRSDHGLPTPPGKIEQELSKAILSYHDKAKHGLSGVVDEAHLRTAILETNVLSHVNYMKWKWDLIHSLIEGPLTNPKRLDEAIRTSKFMKRLVGFYRPFKRRFSNVKNTKPNQRYIRTGCALMRLLVSTAEGTRYLIENKLLRQIAECLAQVDHMSGLTSAQPIFSREHMAETLSGGYFAMLGVLSSETNGLLMMERWHMHNMFYHIIDLQDRPDLIQCLLGNMSYTHDSHMRVLLSKALTTGTKEIRIFCTRLLRKYVLYSAQAAVNMAAAAPMQDRNWVIQLLVTQLYDPDVAVCEVAVQILEEACNQPDCLECIVRCRPSLDHLSEIGAPLLLRFLSTSVGYHYLDGLDYISQEMDDWFLGRNDAYVNLVEASLTRAYVEQPRRNSVTTFEELADITEAGLVPPHFYRELARTAEGCKLLEDSGHFLQFATTIREFDLNEEDPEILLKTKGCLWAVGNVGSMELSAPFLEETDIVPRIVEVAESAGVLAMRGTAFFVLGLISRSKHGLEMLLEAGWDAAVDHNGRSLGCCLPLQVDRLYPVYFLTPAIADAETAAQLERYKAAVTDPDPLQRKILSLFVDLGNSILAKKAAADLQTIRIRRPAAFMNLALIRKVLVLLESHHYRIHARRFALEVFDRSVINRYVLAGSFAHKDDFDQSDSDDTASSLDDSVVGQP
ncbi:hypothetical protein KEM52_004409 [Ascosphaera acerosa]|nr:hypothetical protein KEM52_004409 [Ascosphaera acerosa]